MTGVSVIVPVRNAAEHLEAALASIRGQTRPPDECIVVVGASSDDTLDIVRRHDWVDVILQNRSGLGDARNLGVARSTGDVITFLDADDLWTPEKIEQQMLLLRRHDGDTVVTGMMTRVSTNGAVDVPVPGFTPGAIMAHRATLDAVGPFDNQYRIACDTDWLMRCREMGLGPTVAGDVVLRKGVRVGSLSTDIRRYQAEMLTVVRAASMRLDARRSCES